VLDAAVLDAAVLDAAVLDGAELDWAVLAGAVPGAVVLVDLAEVLGDEPPHAASSRLASTTASDRR
jgi:hypothetical protein